MKPKYRNFARILPTVVSITLSLPFAAQAGIFADDTAGNAQPTAADNGANTIRADGGTNVTNPLVTIIAGVNMTGSIAPLETEVLEITAANYTVTNAGVLSGSNHHGIFSTQTFTLNNNGTIVGGAVSGSWSGVRSTNATIGNDVNGIITGTDDGIHFTAAGGEVQNAGRIEGLTGGTSDGIRGRDNLAVYNLVGGIINGEQHGIYANANIYVENQKGAQIAAKYGDGIHLDGNGGNIQNYGSIRGTVGNSADGIRGRDNLIVHNNTNYDINSNAISGGQINGIQYGVLADNNVEVSNFYLATITGDVSGIVLGDDARIYNYSSITGNNGDGIRADDGAEVTNYAGATITGTGGTGVWLDDNASVSNAGTIIGTASGVRVSDNSTVTNARYTGALGIISGNIGIDAFGGAAGTFTLNNWGTITGTGGTAIDGVLGADTLNLTAGSIINGDIILNSGADNIFMTASSALDNVVNGNINGGSGYDTLTFDGVSQSKSIVNGNVTFMQDIIKTGAGVAFIGEAGGPTRTVQTDAIHVSGSSYYGGLFINGNVDGSLVSQTAITVDGGQVGGNGTWNANISLTNGAYLTPGGTSVLLADVPTDALGTLTVTGDVTLDSTSKYILNTTPGGMRAQLVLSGAGNVFTVNNSGFVIGAIDSNSPLLDGSRIVIDTDATLVGDFGSISVLPLLYDDGPFYANQNNPIIAQYFSTLTKVNGSQDWMMTITHDYGQFGTTKNEMAAGEMLNGLVDTATGDLADLLAAMDYSNEAYTQRILSVLDPSFFMDAAAGLANNNYRLHRTVEGHNAAVRAGALGPACSGTSNVWGSFSYDAQDLNASSSELDQDGDVYAFTAGIDFTLAENLRLGFVAEGSQTNWDGAFYRSTDVDSYRFAAYANWGAATGWFADALLGYNSHNVDIARSNGFNTEHSQFDADGWQGLINVGYNMATSAGTVSPFVGLEWQQFSVDSFDTEDGPLSISIGGYDINSVRALAGVRWEKELMTNVKGYASAAYAFELGGDAPDTKVGFGGGSYRATGMEPGDSALISAGVRWGVAACTTIDIGYRGEFAMDDGVDSNGGNIGVNYSF